MNNAQKKRIYKNFLTVFKLYILDTEDSIAIGREIKKNIFNL